VLAEAVGTSERAALLQVTLDRMKDLVREKDRLLIQKKVLAEELQHRVRNNLQLVYGMLSKQLDETTDSAGQRGLKAIARRVSTLAQVYNQLLGTEMTSFVDFGAYVEALCTDLKEVHSLTRDGISLDCTCEFIELELDVVTALGIVVAELVTNSFDHAFSAPGGVITVSLHRKVGDEATAILTIGDDGSGFEPQVRGKRHGLGLVRRLVEQSNGSIAVDSVDGCVWTISFPAPFTSEKS